MNRSQFQFVVLSTFYRLFIDFLSTFYRVGRDDSEREREGKNKKKGEKSPQKTKEKRGGGPINKVGPAG